MIRKTRELAERLRAQRGTTLNPQAVLLLLLAAITAPLTLPAAAGAGVACAALLGALLLFVRAGALRWWLVALLPVAAVVAALAGG